MRGDYVASPRNICSLLIEDLSVNFSQLLADVKKVLATLESESYVQRVGDNYEYLTDSEKDLDSEIKHIIVDQSEVTAMLKDILFAGVIRGRKITTSNGQSYAFTQMLDNAVVGRPDGDLSVHFITPVNPDAADLTTIIQNAFGKEELTIVLKPDPAVLADIQNYLKTTKFLAQNPPMSQPDAALRNLLESRQTHKGAISKRVEVAIKDMITTAKILVKGVEITPRSSDPTSRVVEGFSDLADKVYSYYHMVESMAGLTEADVPRFLRSDPQLPGINDESEAEREIVATITTNSRMGITTTMKILLDKFEKKPYGWPLVVVECLVAKLLAKGKLEASQGGESVDPAQRAAALRNTRVHETLVLQPQTQITPQQIRKLKDFAKDFFSTPIADTEAKQVAMAVHGKLVEALNTWNAVAAKSGEYPFVVGLAPSMEKVRILTAKAAMNLYQPEAMSEYEPLLTMKETDVDRIISIVNGPQGATFKEAREFAHKEEPNFRKMQDWGGEWANAYVKFQSLAALVESVEVYKNTGMVQITSLLRDLKTDLRTAIEKARNDANRKIDEKTSAIKAMEEYGKTTDDVRTEIDGVIASVKSSVMGEALLTAISGLAYTFGSKTYFDLMNRLVASVQPPQPPPQPNGGNGGAGDTPPPPPPPRVVVPYTSVARGYTKQMITSKDEIEDYLAFIRAKLEAAIADGKRIAFN